MVVFYLKPTGAICWILMIDYQQKKIKVNACMSEQIIKHSVHLGINPPLFRQASPPRIYKLSKSPFLGNSPYILLFSEPHRHLPSLENPVFLWTPILKFSILKNILSFKNKQILG